MEQQPLHLRWKPEFISPNTQEGRDRLYQLVNQPGILIFDEIRSQLAELISLSTEQPLDSEVALDEEIRLKLDETPLTEYGVWVYYPWSNRLVHLLDQEEFIQLKTDRNRNKITPEEQRALLTKKVGIMGLSVGNAVALTMAMERCFGELRLADFDELALTNLNRIRTGVHNLGLSKTICTAREIMEIDPFLNLTCYEGGVSEENVAAFLTEGGQLDLLVDECDSMDIKVLARQEARSRGIPVVMETSDRGMLDIERFDLTPDRPIFHGLLDGLSYDKVREMKTSQEKLSVALAIVGFDSISDRLKQSFPEIGKTLHTWPQLASAVTLGGGVVTDIARKILLNMPIDSGRYYVDLDEIMATRHT